MNKEIYEYKIEVQSKTAEELMSDMETFDDPHCHGAFGDIVRDEIERRLNNYDKIMRGEITIEEVSTEQEFKAHIDKDIDD